MEEETNPNVVYDLKKRLMNSAFTINIEVERFTDIFYSGKRQMAGDMGRLQGTIKPALDRYEVLMDDKKDLFKSTLLRFNRIYAFITQVCRLFDKDIHKFSVYAKFLATMLPKGGIDKVYVDDKVLLEYYRLEKNFEGNIGLEGTEEGFHPIMLPRKNGKATQGTMTIRLFFKASGVTSRSSYPQDTLQCFLESL